MSFDIYEESRDSGKPVELYKFVSGSTEFFRCDAEIPVTYNGDVYERAAISHDEPKSDADNTGQLRVTLPDDDEIITFFMNGPALPIDVTIYAFHRDDYNDTRIVFMGQVVRDDASLPVGTLVIDPIMAQLDLDFPHGLAQKKFCTWTTFDPLTCGLDRATYTFDATIASVTPDKMSVHIEDLPLLVGLMNGNESYLRYGILTFGEFQGMIDSQDGGDLFLMVPMRSLVDGVVVQLTAGDDRTPETCRDKFDNVARGMFFPNLPVQNVFYGQGLRG